MNTFYTSQQIRQIVVVLNGKFNCSMDPGEFQEGNYSASSLSDILAQRILDEISGEWTTERAYDVLKKSLQEMGVAESSIRMEARLEDLIPRANRRARMIQWSQLAGIPLEVLKPNSLMYGTLVLLFFVLIPLGFGVDWFFSGIGMLLCACGIFLLNKTASNFRMQTLGQMAEAVAWKLYLQQQKSESKLSIESVTREVRRLMEEV